MLKLLMKTGLAALRLLLAALVGWAALQHEKGDGSTAGVVRPPMKALGNGR